MRKTATMLFVLGFANAVLGQGTTDGGPFGNGAPTSESFGPCDHTERSFDVTAASADVAILGVAHAKASGKWFFSGRNGAVQGGGLSTQVLHVFDEDRDGRPAAGTWRAILQRGVTLTWGHRDLAYDPVANLIFAGDDARTIHAIDPATETYTGAQWTLLGLARPTVRALAVETVTGAFGPATLRVACCDFTSPIELWDLEPTAPHRALFTGIAIANPGNTYGLAFAPGGTSLVAFRQGPDPCNGTSSGRHALTVLDPLNGTARFARGGDETVLGEPAWPLGGLAGGCEITTVSNQRVVCAVQQGLADHLVYLPLGGHSFLDDASGCPAGPRLLPLDNATLPNANFGLTLRGLPPNTLSLLLLETSLAPVPFPLPNGCLVEVPWTAPLTFLLTGSGPQGPSIALPLPADPALEGREVLVDSLEFSTIRLSLTTSSQRLHARFGRSRF